MRSQTLAELMAPKPAIPGLLSKSSMNSPSRHPVELGLLIRANRDLIKAKTDAGELIQNGRKWRITGSNPS